MSWPNVELISSRIRVCEISQHNLSGRLNFELFSDSTHLERAIRIIESRNGPRQPSFIVRA
jgi:hypothetical protein